MVKLKEANKILEAGLHYQHDIGCDTSIVGGGHEADGCEYRMIDSSIMDLTIEGKAD